MGLQEKEIESESGEMQDNGSGKGESGTPRVSCRER